MFLSRLAFGITFVVATLSFAAAQDKDASGGGKSEARRGYSGCGGAGAIGDSPVKATNPSTTLTGTRWALRNRGYYEPLIAEPRAATVSILFPARSDEFPFSQNPGRRMIWDISLGKEIPIFGYEVGIDDPDTPLPPHAWGIGLWMPINFHMVEDFKDDSNPIINTDYRFSGMVKFQKGISESSRVGARFQFGHESTHLGDEFSLAARRTKPDFERINVSYEYWEYGGSFEKDVGENYFTFRHGGIGLWKPDKGFYSDTLLEPNSRTIARSKRNFEPSFGLQWIYDHKIAGSGWGPFASLDVRHKTIYDYNKPSRDVSEDKQVSWNILIGVRRTGAKRYQKGIPELFFRFYHGVNPNGQFRNQRDYSLLGFGVHFSV